MPFKSQAQRRWMYANEPEMAKKWSEHTPKEIKLPEQVKSANNNNNNKHMTTQQEAYINGFVKRANQYGYSDVQAIELLKESGALGDLVTNAGNAYNNYINQKNTPTPADMAANQRARANYAKQMPRQPAGQQLPPPVQVAPQK
jgi:hypothetical protein